MSCRRKNPRRNRTRWMSVVRSWELFAAVVCASDGMNGMNGMNGMKRICGDDAESWTSSWSESHGRPRTGVGRIGRTW